MPPMDRRALIALYRRAFAGLTIVAIAAQLIDINNRGHLDLLNYFSYFTIDSNLIAAAVLLIGAARWRPGGLRHSTWCEGLPWST